MSIIVLLICISPWIAVLAVASWHFWKTKNTNDP